MESIIKIGKSEFLTDRFIEIVKNSKVYSEVCETLGLNKTTQTTINNIKNAITNLNLNTSHFTYKYTVSDKVGGQNVKEYSLSETNQKYYDAFQNNFDKLISWQQYKVHCGVFLESLKDKDFATITIEDLENYVNSLTGSQQTINNSKAHIRSMMIYVVKNNIAEAFEKVSKEMLLYLITK